MALAEEGTTIRADSESADSARAGRHDETVESFLFSSWAEARAEAVRRRGDPAWEGFVTRVVDSPYGGYLVRSVPLDLFVDSTLLNLVGGTVRYPDR